MKSIAILLSFLLPTAAMASGNKPEVKTAPAPVVEKKIEVAPPPQFNRAELEVLYGRATQALAAVETLVYGSQYGTAYQKAMELLEDIKIKTGINPMAKYRDTIPVDGILANADLHKDFDLLLNWQKEALAREVGNYMGGFFIPLLNVAKRARVIYVKAFYQANKSTMLQRDIDKMRRDLIQVHNFSVLIKDAKANDAYMLFDLDVADEDFQYAFDKEIVLVALSLPELTQTEGGFEQALINDRNTRFLAYNRGLTVAGPAPAPPPPQPKFYTEANFDQCVMLFGMDKDQADNRATNALCEQKARVFDYTTNNEPFWECLWKNDTDGEANDVEVTTFCEQNWPKYQFQSQY